MYRALESYQFAKILKGGKWSQFRLNATSKEKFKHRKHKNNPIQACSIHSSRTEKVLVTYFYIYMYSREVSALSTTQIWWTESSSSLAQLMCDIPTVALQGTGNSAFDRSCSYLFCSSRLTVWRTSKSFYGIPKTGYCAPPPTNDYSSCNTAIDSGDVISGKAAP